MPTAEALDIVTSRVTDGLTFHDPSHTYRLGGKVLPSVTQIIKNMGLGVDYSAVPPDVLRRAAARGSEVHRLTALMDRGEFDANTEFDPALEPYLDAWAKYRASAEWEFILIEEPLASEADATAGTVDRFGLRQGRPSILDIKCALSYHRSYELQVNGGYRSLLIANGIIKEREDVVDRIIIQLKRDGTFETHDPPRGLNHVVALAQWRAALNLYKTYKEA